MLPPNPASSLSGSRCRQPLTHLLYEELKGQRPCWLRAWLTAGKGQPVEGQAGSNQEPVEPFEQSDEIHRENGELENR